MEEKKEAVELTDEQMENAKGGWDLILLKSPKFFSPILRLLFKVKERPEKKPATETPTDTLITGPILAEDPDKTE